MTADKNQIYKNTKKHDLKRLRDDFWAGNLFVCKFNFYLYLFKQNRQIKTKLFGLTSHPGGNKLGDGKAKNKHVSTPRPILGNTISEKSAGFLICCISRLFTRLLFLYYFDSRSIPQRFSWFSENFNSCRLEYSFITNFSLNFLVKSHLCTRSIPHNSFSSSINC